MHTLFYYHVVASVLHILSFVLLLQLVFTEGETKRSLSIPYADFESSAADAVVSAGNTTTAAPAASLVIVQKAREVFSDISITSILIVNEAVTAISHLAAVLGFGLYRQTMVEDDRHLEVIRRYVEYAVTAGLLEAALYLLVGGADFSLLLAIVVTNVIMQILGYMIERTTNVSRQLYMNVSGFILLAIPVVTLLTIGAENTEFQALSIYYTVLYALFGLHSLLHILFEQWRAFVDKDAGYVILGIGAKEVLTWMVVALQFKLNTDNGIVSKPELADSVDVDALLMWLPLGGLLAAVAALLVTSRISIVDLYQAV